MTRPELSPIAAHASASDSPPERCTGSKPLSLWRVGIAALLLGLGASAAYVFYEQSLAIQPELREQEAQVTMPADGVVRTDAFSIRLLQAALRQGKGNVTVAPSAVTEAILNLQSVDNQGIEETCRRFGLEREEPSAATLPEHFIQVFADEAQGLGGEKRTVMPIPIRQDPVQASSFINKLMLPEGWKGDLMVEASDITPDQQFIAAVDQSFGAPWLRPIGRAHTEMLPFTTPLGMPDVPTMQVSGDFRVAHAPDGSWEAVALFFRRADASADSVCLVAVRPKLGTARRMAEKLTAEQVTQIRQSLAEATPRPYNIQLPVMRIRQRSQDMLPLLRELGIHPLPLSRNGDNQGQPSRGALYLQFSITAAESSEEGTQNASAPVESYPTLKINTPYLWWIGSLTSPAPMLYLGVREQP